MTTSTSSLKKWTLVWADEFDAPEIDRSKWSFQVNAWGGGNKELQYYIDSPRNAFIRDGCLVLRAIKEVYTGPEGTRQYTSARLDSHGKGDFLYGRIEARVRVPFGQGCWPAVWMMPTDAACGGWPSSGEIDIMEHRGNVPDSICGSLHYGGKPGGHKFETREIEGPDYTKDFHVYAIEWEEREIRWYVDGQLYSTVNEWHTSAADFPAPFNKRFHLILNLAVGGNFLPDPPEDADYFPRDLEIDYIRVYQDQ